MKCAYANCPDTVTNPLVCKGCNQATYCSNNCRVQDFYKGHNKVCKTKSPLKVASSPEIGKNASIKQVTVIEKKPSKLSPSPILEKTPSKAKPNPVAEKTHLKADASFANEKSPENKKVSSVLKPAPKPNPLSAYNVTSKVLGTGAYGQVKLARHKATQQDRAIKIINKQSLEDEPNGLEIIQEEISTHKQLSHQNIIEYIEDFEDLESIYIVLEYAECGTLFEKIKKDKKIEENEAKELFKQTLNGIQYLHINSKIHRDLKPENILIDKTGCVKICDLGWCGKGGESRKTFCGTLDYMAPEMVKGLQHSYEVDIWALGVLLYEMLHGYAPFEGMREVEKVQNIVQGKLKFEEDISEEAKSIILKMIKVNPKDRIKIEQIKTDPFLISQEKNIGVSIGDEFRYYVQNYGMDDGVIEEINKSECLVGFKKSGMKMKLSVDEIKRRVNRKLKTGNSESVGNVTKLRDMYEKGKTDNSIMDSIGEKLKRLAQEEEENKDGEVKAVDDKMKLWKSHNVIKEIEKPKVNEEIKATNKLVPKKHQNRIDTEEKLDNNEKTEEKNKKPDKIVLEPKVTESNSPAKNLLVNQAEIKLSPTAHKVEKSLPPEPILAKPKELPSPSFPIPKGADSIFARLSQLAEEEEEELEEEKNPLDSIISESKPVNPFKKLKILDSLSQFPESASPKFSKPTSKYPQYFKTQQNPTPPPEKSESPPRAFNPVPPTKTLAPSQAQLEKEYNIYSSLDAYIKAPITRKRPKPKKEKSRDKSLDKTLDNFVKKYTEKPIVFQAEKESSPRKSSPKFARAEKESSSSSEDNIFIKKLRKNFEDQQKTEHPFPVSPRPMEKSPISPKFPINIRDSDSDHSPSRPIFTKEEKKLVKNNNKSPIKKPVIKDFEAHREFIESNHDNYYNNIEEAWIDQQDVVKAGELNDAEVDEYKKPRTFSQYDEVLKNPPSIVGNYEDFSDYQVTKEKLEFQKRELEEIIAKMEKEKNVPIKIRRDKKQKEGFLSWLGDIIGCSDRY